MSEYDNTNRGSIWGNDRKETENHPDFTGTLNVEGVEYWVSAWKRKPDANPKAPALSFSIKRKEDAPRKPDPAANMPERMAPSELRDRFDDQDIPF